MSVSERYETTDEETDATPVASAEHVTEIASARTTLDGAIGHLRSLQSPEGWWKGDLETNVTMDAEDLMLRKFLGILEEKDTAKAANWIRSNQREDGTWATFYGGPGDLSTTIEAYVALRIAGDSPSDPHMQLAQAFVVEAGGIENSRMFTRIWLALFGLWAWKDLPAIPSEVIFLPKKVPFNVYEFGCWARQTLVALTVVAAYQPIHQLDFGVEELRSGDMPEPLTPSIKNWKGRFVIMDRLLHRYETLAQRGIVRATVREFALARAERWIVRRQEADGSWGGIQPPWVYSILALHLRGYALDHPVLKLAFEGLESFMVRGDDTRWLEACQSPVWDTALAAIALADAGVSDTDESMIRAGEWLMNEEVRIAGDWAVGRGEVAPGGWSFEFQNDNYPDVDDTAEVLLALRHINLGDQDKVEEAAKRAVQWTEAMVSADGAWGAFDSDNIREVLYELPISDFGAMIDPPSADVTAHAIEMLMHEPSANPELVTRAITWLRAQQEHDGAWFGRWGVNYVYGTGAVVPALIACGVEQSDPAVVRGCAFLVKHQNEDGGWGEDIRSYDDPSLRGVGASTASQTAWALMALVAGGQADSVAARRGIAWLTETQLDNGTWDEPWYTGTGFPGDFYINYHLYRLVFPISAIGRWLTAVDSSAPSHSAPAKRHVRRKQLAN